MFGIPSWCAAVAVAEAGGVADEDVVYKRVVRLFVLTPAHSWL
jgi:hypothetical protein